jgi:hypothetical protein
VTPEERLRALLHAAAEEHDVRPDALPRLRARVADRRTGRQHLLPFVSAAAGLVVAVAAVVVVSPSAPSGSPLAVDRALPSSQPADEGAPDDEGCDASGDQLCVDNGPPPAVPVTSGVTTSGPGTPFWPFVDDREAAAWASDPSGRAWARDPQQVAQRLVDELLGLEGVTAGAVAGTAVPLLVDGDVVGTVALVQVGVGAGMPWSVVGVTSEVLAVDGPDPGQRVGSPLLTEGTATAGDGAAPDGGGGTEGGAAPGSDGAAGATVTARLLTSSGREVAGRSSPVTDGGWSVGLDWSDLTWSVGATVVTATSPDRSVAGLALVPVRRSGAAGPGVPPAATTFVAADRGVVVLHDARDGRRLRQLSSPPEGARDAEPSRGGDGTVFVRRRADPCRDELLRVSLGTGAAGITAPPDDARRRLPALSPDGRVLAWVEQPCSGGVEEIVVRGADARERRLPLTTERVDLTGVRSLAVTDDGALLLTRPAGGVSVLAADAKSVDTAAQVDTGTECPDTAPAWSGDDVVLWRGCGPQVGLLLAAPDYGYGLMSPSEPVAGVLRSSVAQSSTGPQVLVGLGTDDEPGPVARLVDGRLVVVFANQGCRTGGPCLSHPSW